MYRQNLYGEDGITGESCQMKNVGGKVTFILERWYKNIYIGFSSEYRLAENRAWWGQICLDVWSQNAITRKNF